MQRFCRNVGLIVLLGVALACALSCGGKKGKKGGGTTAKHHTEKNEEVSFDYQVFAPLPKIITEEPSMPMLVDQTGIVETACFEPLKLEPEIAGLNVKKTLEENSDTLNNIIRRWVLDDVAPSGLAPSDADKWEITAASPLSMGIDTDMLRFANDQGCVQSDTGWLATDVHAATTLFGSKKFLFETDTAIGVETQDQMAEAFKDKGIVMKSEALEYYRPALDEEGQQKKDKEGNYLYTAPGGLTIPETKLPPEKDRGMKEWTIEAEKPVYFAFSELPDDAWVKESKKNHCDVYLIWGDVTPRSPECEEFTAATFEAKKNKDNTVTVEVTVGKEVKKVDISWETTEKLEFDKRIILWINAKEDKEGEGISIRTNSITIGKQR